MTDKQKQDEFMKVFEPLRERLSRFVSSIIYNRAEASDVFSETILRCYENFEKIRNKDAFLCYFFSVSSRLNKRRIWRNRLFGDFNEEYALKLRSNDTSPENKIDVEILYQMIRKLPVKYQEAIVLFEISGFSIEEISNMQKSSISAVKSRLKRGRERLAFLMKDKYKYFENLNLQDDYRGVFRHNVFEINKNIEKFNVRVLND